jgi:nitrogen regulatory protein PII
LIIGSGAAAPSDLYADFDSMKQLVIIVKPFRAEAVLRTISELDVSACVVREAKGYSRQKGYLDRYVGSEYSMAFVPKVEISVWISDERAEEVTDRLVRTARTGRIGDGKVFAFNTAWPDSIDF